jgi:dephospho-CoA kinase
VDPPDARLGGGRPPRRPARRGGVPLLFEAGMEKDWDAVVCVASDEQTMLERLAATRPFARRGEGADRQPMAGAREAARADRVIENNGSLAELEKSAGPSGTI